MNFFRKKNNSTLKLNKNQLRLKLHHKFSRTIIKIKTKTITKQAWTWDQSEKMAGQEEVVDIDGNQ